MQEQHRLAVGADFGRAVAEHPGALLDQGIARRYAQLGETEESLRWLRRGYEQHTFLLPFINAAPAYDGLRADPRFADIVRHIGLAQ